MSTRSQAVRRCIDAFIDTWAGTCAAAMPAADRVGLTAYLRFPAEHHKRIWHVIERTVGETRRNVRGIGRFPGETSCISPVRAVLDRPIKADFSEIVFFHLPSLPPRPAASRVPT
ncbi:transposase [Streptomyces sp. NBC_00154]|uniref:transposase n=1 Tax=Streptomyces sp. NBC_00154 TaxID=2975670 RepID=UPI00338F3A94